MECVRAPGRTGRRGSRPKMRKHAKQRRSSDRGEESAEDFIGEGVCFDYLSEREEEEEEEDDRIRSSLGCC